MNLLCVCVVTYVVRQDRSREDGGRTRGSRDCSGRVPSERRQGYSHCSTYKHADEWGNLSMSYRAASTEVVRLPPRRVDRPRRPGNTKKKNRTTHAQTTYVMSIQLNPLRDQLIHVRRLDLFDRLTTMPTRIVPSKIIHQHQQNMRRFRHLLLLVMTRTVTSSCR